MNQVVDTSQFDDADQTKLWLLAQIKPNMMPRAQNHLENQGFRIFVPMLRTTQRVAGRFREKLAPLFPGYIFVQVDPKISPWRKINSTYGVSKLVSFTMQRPAVVPSGLITDLRSRFTADIDVATETRLEPGDEVQVIRGPFAGFAAKVEQTAAGDRIWLLLDLLGRETRVSADTKNVIRA
ncbi:transcription termination/antitermination NusG family protein [Primorskyibacter sp. S87]|uniref:transcription termination/antitermination NusG family protein n=1 Tax=Primorskyibacter sp. S87 TaxID=3415126 RepID=UPI003C7D6CE2